LIRIKQSKDFSKSRALLIFEELDFTIKNISNNNSKVIHIGE
jgi:hypothetical protein